MEGENEEAEAYMDRLIRFLQGISAQEWEHLLKKARFNKEKHAYMYNKEQLIKELKKKKERLLLAKRFRIKYGELYPVESCRDPVYLRPGKVYYTTEDGGLLPLPHPVLGSFGHVLVRGGVFEIRGDSVMVYRVRNTDSPDVSLVHGLLILRGGGAEYVHVGEKRPRVEKLL